MKGFAGGTADFASLATHEGFIQSRKDDLEMIGHNLLYFLKGGELPWSQLGGTFPHEYNANIKSKMQQTSISELCEGLPKEFKEYMDYCRSLKYDEKPNYNKCIELL